jgi:hypothetical protein
LSLKQRQIRCSGDSWRVVLVWICLEALIRIGIWCGLLWMKSVEIFIACLFLAIFGLLWLDFRIMQINLDSMDEMQEYIDRRLADVDSQLRKNREKDKPIWVPKGAE